VLFAALPSVAGASVARDAQPSMVMVEGARDEASGFALEDENRVITTAAAVGRAERVTLTLADGTAFGGEVLTVDDARGLAILRSEQSLPALDESAVDPAASGSLTAVASPLAKGPSSDQSPVHGEGGAVRALVDLDDPAGAPLLDDDGAVAGVVVAEKSSHDAPVSPVDEIADLERDAGLSSTFDEPAGRGPLPFVLLLVGVGALALVALLIQGRRHSRSLLAGRPTGGNESPADDLIVVLKSADR
jgi:S1-C subfamily serine protease